MRARATTAVPRRTRPLVSAQTGYNDVHNATTSFKSSVKPRTGTRSAIPKVSLDDEDGPLVKALVAADETVAAKDDVAEVCLPSSFPGVSLFLFGTCRDGGCLCVLLAQLKRKMHETKPPSSPIQIEDSVAPSAVPSGKTRQQLITASGRSNDMLVNVDVPGPGSFAIDKKSTLEKGTHNSRLQVGFAPRCVPAMVVASVCVVLTCVVFLCWRLQRSCAAGSGYRRRQGPSSCV
jgi:hypothetical protein